MVALGFDGWWTRHEVCALVATPRAVASVPWSAVPAALRYMGGFLKPKHSMIPGAGVDPSEWLRADELDSSEIDFLRHMRALNGKWW